MKPLNSFKPSCFALLGKPLASMVSSKMATRSWSAYQAGKTVMLY